MSQNSEVLLVFNVYKPSPSSIFNIRRRELDLLTGYLNRASSTDTNVLRLPDLVISDLEQDIYDFLDHYMSSSDATDNEQDFHEASDHFSEESSHTVDDFSGVSSDTYNYHSEDSEYRVPEYSGDENMDTRLTSLNDNRSYRPRRSNRSTRLSVSDSLYECINTENHTTDYSVDEHDGTSSDN